ncbi:hypothetical protein DFH06DRAFT_1119484 [Mycena polygramma]|nr:hypothetical protein DFH06DRAFT_1119484 [Mycena polygramma]
MGATVRRLTKGSSGAQYAEAETLQPLGSESRMRWMALAMKRVWQATALRVPLLAFQMPLVEMSKNHSVLHRESTFHPARLQKATWITDTTTSSGAPKAGRFDYRPQPDFFRSTTTLPQAQINYCGGALPCCPSFRRVPKKTTHPQTTALINANSSSPSTSCYVSHFSSMATESEMEDLECAKTIYVAVKNEFCAWKTEYIAQLFSRIAIRDSSFVSGAMESFHIPVLKPLPTLEPDTVLFQDYDADGKLVGPATVIPLHTAEAAQSFSPHPPYQFCTPVSRSHTARMIDNQTAPFIPYPEDASFPREEYLKEFQGFQWVLDQQDPDGKFSSTVTYKEVIQFETVRRLHLDHGFSVERIDHLLNAHTSFRSLRLSNESGLLWDISQRYNSQTWIARLIPYLVNYDWECLTAPIEPKEPRHTSQDLHAQVENPCENECFLLLAEEDMDVDDHMSANCLEVLQSMLKLEPDMLPCDLAVICKIECRRVFLRRQHIIKDCDVARPTNETEGSKKLRRKRQLLEKRKTRRGLNFVICRARTQGPAPRRTVIAIGSTSTVNRVADVTQTVSAAGQAAIRPVRGALSAVIGAASVGLPIANVIQNGVGHVMRGGRGQTIDVRNGGICDRDNIAEGHRRGAVIHKHSGLNYCFGMKGTTIDAQWAGNPMRFLNDSKPRKPNCQAEEMVVNDERRIVIRAAVRIEAGKELTLDYGKKYWAQSGPRA